MSRAWLGLPPYFDMPRTLYRIVQGPTVTHDDLRSNLANCKPPRGPELINASIWAGLSTYDTREGAERTARRYKYRLGAFIAEMTIPDDDPRLLIQPTLADGHHTLLGCERACLSCTARVAPIN